MRIGARRMAGPHQGCTQKYARIILTTNEIEISYCEWRPLDQQFLPNGYLMSERFIIGTKNQANVNKPWLGLIDAIAEDIDGKLLPITEQEFCPTRQVFIVTGYEEIEAKFRVGELFRIRVELNQAEYGPCKYKALAHAAQKLLPNDIAEVIDAKLPDRNVRRLNVSALPGTKYILIRNSAGDCYGPFDWEEKSQFQDEIEIELKIVTSGGLGKVGGDKRWIVKIPAAKIAANAVDCDSVVGKKNLAQNVPSIVAGCGLEEYANDKEIIDYVKDMAPESIGRTIDRKNLETLSNLAKSKQKDSPLNKSRIALFDKIVASNADLLGDINKWFETYLKNEAGAKILESYVQANRGRYIDRLKADKEAEINDEIKLRQDELDQVKKAIEEFRKERTCLNDEIEAKHRALEKDVLANQKAYLEKASEENHAKIAAMNAEEETASKRITEIRERLAKYGQVDNVEAMVLKSEGALQYLNSQVEVQRKELKALRVESGQEEDDIRMKLRGMKPYVDHLNGAFTGEEFKQLDIKVGCKDISGKEEIHDQRLIIESVKTRLAGLDRSLEYQEVVNLLISTQQSFITFFAGLPGVGKTSLCNLMIQAQGVEKRLLSVSVARGWTSIKDMVGFHNPLNDRFQPASTGMYEFLRALDAEMKAGGFNPMSYILLDEANLSSIEHYWSAFMGMADATTSQNLPIGQDSLVIPRSLRFLATINYDGTTEPLSPRILNRAGVIVMQPGEIASRQSVDESILQALPLSSENMDALFGLFDKTPELEIGEKSALEAISKVLGDSAADKGRSIHISQRKINAIRQYCGRARPLMRSDGNEVTAMDWAIMQHVLPQVTGHGKKFGNRLSALKKCFEEHDLEKSAVYLDRMILSGQSDLDSYEFFCW